jgi:2-dehydropantoate 2-reductase
MKIGIIGGGAIGLFYAYHLSKVFDVTIYVKREYQLNQLKHEGISVHSQEAMTTITNLEVKLWYEEIKPTEEVLIVAVKQYALKHVMPVLEQSRENQTILFLQNGMAHIELIKHIKHARVLLGVIEHGVKKLNDTSVSWTGVGMTKIADYDISKKASDSYFIMKWKDNLDTGFRVELSPDFHNMMTEKLLVNAIINPLTALYRVKNGELLANSFYQETMRIVFDEISFLISDKMHDGMWNHITNICKRTAGNWSSMEQDVREGRQTEIDAISGYIIKMAAKQGKEVPVTEFIYQAVKGLESKQGL